MSEMLNMPNEVLPHDVKKVLDEMAQDYADRLLSDKPDMMGVHEVADMLTLSERFIYNEISEGKLFSFKFGRKIVIPKESIRDYLVHNTL